MGAFSPKILRITRQLRGITQTQVAHAVGRSQAFVSQMERGRRPPSTEEIKALAQALGVESDDPTVNGTRGPDLSPALARLIETLAQAAVADYIDDLGAEDDVEPNLVDNKPGARAA